MYPNLNNFDYSILKYSHRITLQSSFRRLTGEREDAEIALYIP